MSAAINSSAAVSVRVNGQTLDLPTPLSVRQLLQRLRLPERGVAVEVDGRIVPKSEWDSYTLQNGARMELVQMVGGGA